MSRYRSKSDFQVTVSELCSHCQTLQREVLPRREYLFRHGWVEQTSCYPCFEKARDAAKKALDDNHEYWYGSN